MHEHTACPQVQLKTGTTPETTDVLSILEKGEPEAVPLSWHYQPNMTKSKGETLLSLPEEPPVEGFNPPHSWTNTYRSMSLWDPAKDSRSNILTLGKHVKKHVQDQLPYESSVSLPHSQLIKVDGYCAKKVFIQTRVILIDTNKSPFFTTGLQTITETGDKVINYQKKIY